MKKLLLLSLFCCVSAFASSTLPDSSKTPGAIDPKLTKDIICSKTFSTSTVRNVSTSVRAKVFADYNVKNYSGYCTGPKGCELDHLIPLELGGSNDITNLWPSPYAGDWNASIKDKLENKLHNLVCKGQLPLDVAQKEIASNWIKAYQKYNK